MESRLRLGERTLTVGCSDAADGRHAVVDGGPQRFRSASERPVGSAAGVAGVELALAVDGGLRRALVVRSGERILVALDGRSIAFALGDAPRRPGAGTGVGTTVSPMPGTVRRVLVAVGDVVEPGHALVVLEAMKMETTLRAEIAGTVSAVSVSEGAMVDAGAVLIEIVAQT